MQNPYREAGNMDVDISAGSQWWWKLPAALAMIGLGAAFFCWIAIGLKDCNTPEPIPPCVESVTIVTPREFRQCPHGAHMWSAALSDDNIAVHCVCGTTIDAGTHP